MTGSQTSRITASVFTAAPLVPRTISRTYAVNKNIMHKLKWARHGVDLKNFWNLRAVEPVKNVIGFLGFLAAGATGEITPSPLYEPEALESAALMVWLEKKGCKLDNPDGPAYVESHVDGYTLEKYFLDGVERPAPKAPNRPPASGPV